MNRISYKVLRNHFNVLWMMILVIVASAPAIEASKKVIVDWDKEADFSHFKTFAYSDEGLPFINENAGVAIREMISAELGIKDGLLAGPGPVHGRTEGRLVLDGLHAMVGCVGRGNWRWCSHDRYQDRTYVDRHCRRSAEENGVAGNT